MGYSGARGKLIHEKNLKSKISCQTPFTVVIVAVWYLRTEHIYFTNSLGRIRVDFEVF
jgi:hypothetical protein